MLEDWRKHGAMQGVISALTKVGAGPFLSLEASIYILNMMQAAIGSQWRKCSNGVVCVKQNKKQELSTMRN